MVGRRSAALAALLVVLASSARANGGADPVFKFFQEEAATATTALRHPARTDRSPLAVDVITAEEIKASGAINVWDLLRFRVGMDVIEGRSSAGTDRAIVSVRGMPRDLVTELQVLIDGRSVYSPLDGGVIWDHLPVQIQDIERIEIVRGPNAALYGPNAGLGVINIITRTPAKSFEASATGLGGTLNTRLGSASVEAANSSAGARLSASDLAQDGFPKADGTGMGSDWAHKQTANFRSWLAAGPGTKLELLAGVSAEGNGESSQNISNNPQGHSLNHFQTLRLTHAFDGGSTLEARASRTDDDTVTAPDTNGVLSDTHYWQYDSEAFHSVPWADGHLRTTYGMQWRYAAARSNTAFGPDSGVVTNRMVRGFFHQEIRVVDSLSLIGGLSQETANIGGYARDFQVAALWSPVENQSLRASYSRANTMPGLLNRYANLTFSGGAGSLVGNQDLNRSPLTDYEAGWMGRFFDQALTAEFTGYYMYVQDHINIDAANPAPGAFFGLTYDNTNTLQLRGMEASLKWRFAPGRSLYANYTRETVTDQDHHSLFINTTPKNKFNAGFDAAVPGRLRLSSNAGYKDAYLADSNTGTAQEVIPAYWRLDARLGWQALANLELFVAGQNLLAPTRREYIDGLVVPRMIEGGATLRY